MSRNTAASNYLLWRVRLPIFFHKKLSVRRLYVSTGYSIKNCLWNSVWKASTLCGPTCTISSLVTNLVPFWRLLTYQSTILHCYLPAHARCATWHPVQHDILCNIESENCGSGGQKINKPHPRPMPLVYCHESLTLCYNSNIHFLLWLHACCLWNVQTPSAVNRHHRLRWGYWK